MSDNLPQDQIEALLNSLGSDAVPTAAPSPVGPLSAEDLDAFGALQEDLWQAISTSTSEGAGKEVTFGNPLAVNIPSAELQAEFGEPLVVIQFGLSAMPDCTQLILIPAETATALAAGITGAAPAELDENSMADLRPSLEGVVQGLCIAVGQLTGDVVGATGLAIHFSTLSLPANLQGASVVRTQVSVTAAGVDGTAVWLIDSATAHFLLGRETAVPSGIDLFGASHLHGAVQPMYDDDAEKVARLLDIPLTLDVELARIKMLVKDAAELATGSIVEMEKAVGELVDVLVSGRLVARGEVVVVDDYFGVRITEILDPRDRLTREIAAA